MPEGTQISQDKEIQKTEWSRLWVHNALYPRERVWFI